MENNLSSILGVYHVLKVCRGKASFKRAVFLNHNNGIVLQVSNVEFQVIWLKNLQGFGFIVQSFLSLFEFVIFPRKKIRDFFLFTFYH